MRIVLKNMSFGYSRGKHVFQDVDLDVTRFPLAVLGPNGAGKSTLLSLLAGQLEPRDGSVVVEPESGAPARTARDLRRYTSLMPQDIRPIRGLAAGDQVAYAGWLKGMPSAQAAHDAQTALNNVGLRGRRKSPVTSLSGGQRRRVGIASAAVSAPALLLLDEPYAGLDPEQRGSVRSALQNLDGAALVVSTHQTEDLDGFYEGVLVVDRGHFAFVGSTAEFLGNAPAATPQTLRAGVAYQAVLRSHNKGRTE